MGDYIEVSDIEARLREEFDGNSKPTESQVQDTISRKEGTINSVLDGLGYSVPIKESESPNAYDFIVDWALPAAAAEVVSQWSGLNNGTTENEESLREEASEQRSLIMGNKDVLGDAKTDSGESSSFRSSADSEDTNVDANFSRDTVF